MKKTRIVTILICITLLMASIFVFSACEMGNFDSNGDNSDTQTVRKESEGLTYQLNTEGTVYTVTGIGTCIDTDLIIPSTYNNLPVTSIGSDAFWGCTSLTSVTSENPDGWYAYDDKVDLDLTDISRNATYLKSTYCYCDWYKK